MTPKPVVKVPAETCVETYLRQATRGLWGRKRLEVREELAAHLHERALSYQLAGLSETDAVKKALAELGKPQEVSLGMAKLYTFPTLLKSGTVLAAACVCVVALLPKGTAQTLAATPYFPSTACVKAIDAGKANSSKQCFGFSDIWFNRQALRAALEPQGVKVGQAPAPGSDAGLLSLTFPGSSTAIYIPIGTSGYFIKDYDGSILRQAPGYLSLWGLLRFVSLQEDLKTEVSGWNSPTVKFGDISLKIGTAKNPITGYMFYDSYMSKVYSENLAPDPAAESTYVITPRLNETYNQSFENVPLQRTVVEVPGAARNVYGIATRLDPAKTLDNTPSGSGLPNGAVWDEAVSLSVSRADAQGNVNFTVPKGPLHFVKSFTEKLDPGAAILVKLNSSGTNWYEVVAPESVTVQ